MVEANGAAQSIFSQNYKYTFGVLSPANKYLQGVLDMAATLNPKPTTIALLSADDSFSLEVADGINTYAPTKGMTVVLYKKYKNGATNLSAEVQAAKAANADIVLNSGHLLEAIAINKAAKEQKLNAKIFAYSVGPSTPDFITALGADANYVYDGSQWTPQVKYMSPRTRRSTLGSAIRTTTWPSRRPRAWRLSARSRTLGRWIRRRFAMPSRHWT